MSQDLSSAAVVIGAFRVKFLFHFQLKLLQGNCGDPGHTTRTVATDLGFLLAYVPK